MAIFAQPYELFAPPSADVNKLLAELTDDHVQACREAEECIAMADRAIQDAILLGGQGTDLADLKAARDSVISIRSSINAIPASQPVPPTLKLAITNNRATITAVAARENQSTLGHAAVLEGELLEEKAEAKQARRDARYLRAESEFDALLAARNGQTENTHLTTASFVAPHAKFNSVKSMVAAAVTVTMEQMDKTSVGRGTIDYLKQEGKVLHSEWTAVKGVGNIALGTVTGNAEQLHRGMVVVKAGIERRSEMIDHKAGTVADIAGDAWKAAKQGDGSALMFEASRVFTGLRRNIIGDHTNNELDKLLPELEAKGWGKIKDRHGNDLFGIGNGHLTSKHIREVLETHGIHLKDENGHITGKEITDLMGRVVRQETQAKSITKVRDAVDINNDGKVTTQEIGQFLKAQGVTAAQADKNHDGSISNAELAVVPNLPHKAPTQHTHKAK